MHRGTVAAVAGEKMLTAAEAKLMVDEAIPAPLRRALVRNG